MTYNVIQYIIYINSFFDLIVFTQQNDSMRSHITMSIQSYHTDYAIHCRSSY